MPEEHDERAAHGGRGDFDDFDDEEFDDYGEPDDFDDLDDLDDDDTTTMTGPVPTGPRPGSRRVRRANRRADGTAGRRGLGAAEPPGAAGCSR